MLYIEIPCAQDFLLNLNSYEISYYGVSTYIAYKKFND